MPEASQVTRELALMGSDVGTQAITFVDSVMSSTVVANCVFFCMWEQTGQVFEQLIWVSK